MGRPGRNLRRREARPPNAVRRAVCAAIPLFFVGCGAVKGCSCDKTPPKPVERVYTEVEMLGSGTAPRVDLRVVRWSGLRYRMVFESTGAAGLEGQPTVPGPTVIMTMVNDVLVGSADPITIHRDAG